MIITTLMMDNAPGVSRQWSALPVAGVLMLSLTNNVTSVELAIKTIRTCSRWHVSYVFTIQSLIAD